MAQHDYVIANGTGAAVRSDLNNALAAIVSNNSGATEPATMYAYQWWADTSTGLLKLRNAANNAWISLRELDGTLTIEDGTASSPGLAFADDLNTGIYSPSADQLGITTGGTVRLTTTTTGITSALPVDVPLGTASAPTVTFTGDLNTGIYSPGADQVAISTNGSGRLFVDSTGRVGIGSSAPGAQLDVASSANSIALRTLVGSTVFFSVNNNSNGAIVDFNDNGGTLRNRIDGRVGFPSFITAGSLGIGYTTPGNQNASASQLVVGNTSQNNGITILTGTTNDGVLNFNDGDNNSVRGYVIYEHSSDSLRFASNGSERFRCDSSGRLLVGTSTARGNLFSGSVSSQLQVEGTSTTDRIISVISSNSDGNAPPFVAFGKQNSGTVGGNTAVTSGNILGAVSFQGSDGTKFVRSAEISAEVDGTPGANDMPGRLVFSTTADGASSPTERMRIQANGRITLGGGAEATQGSVSFYPSYSTGAGTFVASTPLLYWNRADSASTGTACLFQNSGTTVGTITYTNSATAYNTSSDYRLKENVTPVIDGISRLQQLKPSRFNFIADPDHTVDGFIAHEVQCVVPEAITGTKDEIDDDGNPVYQGIDQSKLVPLLTAALQEAIERIEKVEVEKAEQQTVLDDLLARVAALEAA